MVQPETLDRIRFHAGLQDIANSHTPSLDRLLWEKKPVQIAVDDLIQTFQRLNLELNGFLPSESLRRDQCIPRALTYAIFEILSVTRDAAEESADSSTMRDLLRVAKQLEMGWAAVLSGDIDDIVGHINSQEKAGD